MRVVLAISLLALTASAPLAQSSDWFRLSVSPTIAVAPGDTEPPPTGGVNDGISISVETDIDARVYGDLSVPVIVSGIDGSYSIVVSDLPSGAEWLPDAQAYGAGTIAWSSANSGQYASTIKVLNENEEVVAHAVIDILVHDALSVSVDQSIYETEIGSALSITPQVAHAIGELQWGSAPFELPEWLTFDESTGSIQVDTTQPNFVDGLVLTAVDQADLATESTEPFSVAVHQVCQPDEWIAVSTPAGSWQSIAYGNGMFVAVGSGTRRLMTSPNGLDWTTRSTPNQLWTAVAYGNGIFVVAGDNGKILTSTDGTTWTSRNTPVSYPRSLTNAFFGNGKFVLHDNESSVITSSDGVNWTHSGRGSANGTYSTAYGNGKFVTVTSVTNQRVLTSSDGVSWTGHSGAELNGWSGVAYGKGTFVAVSYDGVNRVMTSEDGVTWTPRSAPEQNAWRSIAYGDGVFTAVSANGTNRIMTSPNGIDWTPQPAPEQNAWFSVAFGDGKFAAVSLAGTNQVMISSCE